MRQLSLMDEARTSLDRQKVKEFILSLGLDPHQVKEMHFARDGVTVEYYVTDSEGKKALSPTSRDELWMGTKTFRIED